MYLKRNAYLSEALSIRKVTSITVRFREGSGILLILIHKNAKSPFTKIFFPKKKFNHSNLNI